MNLEDYDFYFFKDGDEFVFSHKGEDFNYKQILDNYKVIRKIGEGGFGKVFLAKEKSTGTKYAIKYIDVTLFMKKADLVKDIYRESKALSQLEHKCKLIFS